MQIGINIAVGVRKSGSAFDSNAQAFITAAGITNPTQQNAINTLVIGLKTDLLWTKMIAIYPFVGGTSTSCKYNLKDPRDLDVAFRLNFVNVGWNFSSLGVTPNGIDNYANTFFIPANNWSSGNSSASVYSKTNNVENTNLWGTRGGSSATLFTSAFNTTGGVTSCFHNTNGNTGLNTTTSALNFISSRINSSNHIQGINGTNQSDASIESSTFSPNPIYLSALNYVGSPQSFSTRQLAFSHIGYGLTQAECTLLFNRIQTFQTTLGRANP